MKVLCECISYYSMTITEEEIREDYQRFLRHEAMRANCSQEKVVKILCKDNFEVFLQYVKLKNKTNGAAGNT